MVRSFWLAVAMATRLPLPDPGHVAAAEVARALSWLPVVGALIGGALVALDQLVGRSLPSPAASVGLIVVWLALTGGVPLASLIRVTQTARDRRLPQRSSTGARADSGAWAGAAIGLGTLVMKFALLALIPPERRWEALLLAPIWGRQLALCALILIPLGLATPYRVREIRRAARRRQLWVAILPLALSGLVWRQWAAPIIVVVALAGWLLFRRLNRALGGLTADAPEAVTEWTELLVLMCCLAAAGNLQQWT